MTEFFWSSSACSQMKAWMAAGIFEKEKAIGFEEDLSIGTLCPLTEEEWAKQIVKGSLL